MLRNISLLRMSQITQRAEITNQTTQHWLASKILLWNFRDIFFLIKIPNTGMKALWTWVWDNECNWLPWHCAGWWWCNPYRPNTDWLHTAQVWPPGPHILSGAGLVLRTLSLTSSLQTVRVESKYLVFVNIIGERAMIIMLRREKNNQPGCSLLSSWPV